MAIIIGEFVNILLEDSMPTKERNALDDDEFGIPELRKYPLHDKKHVLQAIRMFNHVEKKYEAELADNILDAMERYHISTDVVGDKNRLKKYIKEETTYVQEALLQDNTPTELKKLKEKLRELIDIKSGIDDTRDVVQKVKDTIRNRDYSSSEKDLIFKSCNRLGIKIFGYANTSTNIKGIETNNNHKIIGGYKNYIITIRFIGAKGVLSIPIGGFKINYDANKSDIPKGVAFDMLNMLTPNVTKVKSTRRSIKVSGWSESIDSAYPRLSHKYTYSDKYSVKKNPGGFSITLSSLKAFKENSLMMAALPPTPSYDPNAVYVVNYTKKNTFVKDYAICKDKMSSIFITKDGKPINISLSEFKEMATDIKVYKYNDECDFNNVLESWVGVDNIELDHRFTRVPSYVDELNSISECIINSAPKSGMVHEVYCPAIQLVNLNVNESVVHYYRDIDGVFAQNINTLSRSASYKSVEDIPESTINLLQNI